MVACHPRKCNHNDITAQAIKYSADPQKYKPTHFLCFGNPQNFNLSKLNTLTVIILCWINRRIIIYTVPCVTVKYSHLHPVPPTAFPLCGLSARSHDPDNTHLINNHTPYTRRIYCQDSSTLYTLYLIMANISNH